MRLSYYGCTHAVRQCNRLQPSQIKGTALGTLPRTLESWKPVNYISTYSPFYLFDIMFDLQSNLGVLFMSEHWRSRLNCYGLIFSYRFRSLVFTHVWTLACGLATEMQVCGPSLRINDFPRPFHMWLAYSLLYK